MTWRTHCAFTPAETITALETLLNRLSTGRWNVPSPAGLNAEATDLGPNYNIYAAGSTVTPALPASTSYNPPQYPRPFDLPPLPSFTGAPLRSVR